MGGKRGRIDGNLGQRLNRGRQRRFTIGIRCLMEIDAQDQSYHASLIGFSFFSAMLPRGGMFLFPAPLLFTFAIEMCSLCTAAIFPVALLDGGAFVF